MFQLVEAFMNIDYSIDAPDAVNPIDLNTIAKKIENAAYTCCEAFLSDIKWIIHNVKVFWSGMQKKKKMIQFEKK